MSTIAKQDAAGQVGFLSSLFSFGFYKPSQGRLVRQLTFALVALLLVLLAYEVGTFDFVTRWVGSYRMVVIVALGLLGLWVAFRLVNYSRFADFLISVEAEMNKVSWPAKPVLWRASVVVVFVIFALAGMLFVFDAFWRAIFGCWGSVSRRRCCWLFALG
ncbi:MAG: preprotein translocase subunit SecE [Pirellulaceae bacterium]